MEGSIGDTGANSMNRREILKKGHWSHEEDELLLELVRRYGPRRWKHIATHIRGRRGKCLSSKFTEYISFLYIFRFVISKFLDLIEVGGPSQRRVVEQGGLTI